MVIRSYQQSWLYHVVKEQIQHHYPYNIEATKISWHLIPTVKLQQWSCLIISLLNRVKNSSTWSVESVCNTSHCVLSDHFLPRMLPKTFMFNQLFLFFYVLISSWNSQRRTIKKQGSIKVMSLKMYLKPGQQHHGLLHLHI